MFKTYNEPKSPNAGALLRYMTNRNRHMRGVFKIYDEARSPTEEACLRQMRQGNCQMQGRGGEI